MDRQQQMPASDNRQEFFPQSERVVMPLDLPFEDFDANTINSDQDETDATMMRARARLDRIRQMKLESVKAQRERNMEMLSKVDEREEQLNCMSQISALEMKERQAKDLGIENPLTQEEQAILADYRNEFGVDRTDKSVGEVDKTGEDVQIPVYQMGKVTEKDIGDFKVNQLTVPVGEEDSSFIKNKLTGMKIEDEQE